MLGRSVATAGLAACLLGCGDDATHPGEPLELTEAESGRAFSVSVEQEVVVTLESNPSTGYAWSYACSPPSAFAAMGEPAYIANQPVVAGSGGRTRYRFTAQRAGDAALRFDYRRPWEADAPPARTVSYVFVVR